MRNESEQSLRESAEEMEVNEITLNDLEEDAIDLEVDFDIDFEPDGNEEHIGLDEDSDENIVGTVLEEDEEEQKEELEEFKFSFDEIIPSISNPVNRIPEAGVMSVVNSKNGKRVSIAKDVIESIGQPASIQVGFIDTRIVVGEYLGEAYTSYTLKKQGAKHIIYNKDLVEQVTNHYQLDFTNRTSVTFPKATYQRRDEMRVAIITMA